MKSISVILASTALAIAAPVESTPKMCNANAEMCHMKYSKVSYIGTHDSAFVGSLDDPTVNQQISVTGQLDQGIRMLQSQTHLNMGGDLHMCHTDCLLKDAGSVHDYLAKVKSWLDHNPNALITLLLANGDNVGVKKFDAAFTTSGLKHYAFVPSTSPAALEIEQWPTLGQMISKGHRVVVFMDYGADEAKVPYILNEYKYFFETPWGVTDPSGFQQCGINRPPGASPEGRMYLVNHFLDKETLFHDISVPDNNMDSKTNAANGPGSIGAQVKVCREKYGRTPNFVLVDMFNRGEWLVAQHALNFL